MNHDKNITIDEIINFLKNIDEEFQFIGDVSKAIKGFSSIYEYKEGTITWLRNENNYKKVKEKIDCLIKLIVIPLDMEHTKEFENYIKTENPHRVFFSIIEEFFAGRKAYSIGKNNVISHSSLIHPNVYIGNNCTIGNNVKIGEGTKIYNNVTIADEVIIGENCTIKSGAVIGEEGLNYMKDNDGKYRRIEHLGTVIIGNNVDIGANTTIERGVMENTVIEDGVKIDDLCQISHNAFIGENTVIIVHTSIYGSAKIGKNCWIASSIIRNQIKVGDNVIIGMGSVVTKDIRDNCVIFGNPAKERQ